MNPDEIGAVLERAERALDAGQTLRGTGFWAAVDAARRDRALADRFADRMAGIDRRAFEAGVRLRVHAWLGVVALSLTTLAGFGAIYFAFLGWGGALCGFDGPCRPTPAWASAIFLFGLGLLIVGTHSLTHVIVGRALGIRFTHVFLAGPGLLHPGVKTDYASYLRSTACRRAVMHASGAVVTKIIPFTLLVPALIFYFDWNWLMWLLLVLGVGLIVTDVAFSTKVADWMKVKRELRAARGR